MPGCPSLQSFVAHRARLVHGLLGLAACALACSDPKPGPQVGSNSNWLKACATDEVCGDSLGCQCGACTKGCERDADCSSLSDAHCVLEEDSSAQALCRSSDAWSSRGMCRPRCQAGTCADGQVCVLLACTPLQLPTSADCAEVVGQDADRKLQEEKLLDAVEQARLAGTVACGGSAAPPVAAVRPDGRLHCAARLLAADLAKSSGGSLVDSKGRDTAARMALAGYRPSYWAEGFAFSVDSASSAWSEMLQSADFCSVAAGSQLLDVGVGVWGQTYVVTMGAE